MRDSFLLAYPLNPNVIKNILMAERNRNSEKGNDTEKRTGKNLQKDTHYKKLPDDQSTDSAESISTRGDTAGGKYSRTNKRDDEIDNDDTRGGK